MVGAVAERHAKRGIVAAVGLALWAGLSVVCVPLASASEIQTIVCRAPSTVSVDRPANDAVVTAGEVQLAGAVRQANQLELYMDGTLDSVVPLSVTDTTYTATIQLQEGTHTIKVVAIDACQLANTEASVVLTYQPAVPAPSVGAAVPTVVGGEASGVRVGTAPVRAPASSSFLPPQLSGPLRQLGDVLDLNAAHRPVVTGRDAVSQLVRFGLVAASGLVIIFSQTISAAGASGTVLQFAAQRLGLGQISGSRLLTILLAAGGIMLAFLL